MRTRLAFVCALLWCEGGLSFAPRSFSIFEQNCRRLLKGKQYTFLGGYFSQYAKRFRKEQKLYDLVVDLSRRMPLLPVKEKILNTALQGERPPALSLSRVYHECGKLHYFQTNWGRARKFFSRSKDISAHFYLAKIARKYKESGRAEKHFQQFLKKVDEKSLLRAMALLELAEIEYERGNYSKSYGYSIQSRLSSAERAILLHRIYTRTGEQEKKKRMYRRLVENYRDNPKTRAYLKMIAQKKGDVDKK